MPEAEIEELVDALNSRRCVLCYLYRKDLFDLICKWVSTTEEAVKKETLKQKGFCNYHLWKLREISTEESTAYLARFFLQDFLLQSEDKSLEEVTTWLKNYSNNQRDTPHKNTCLICAALSELESKRLGSFMKFIGTKENMDLYRASRGLCIPHFIKTFLSAKSEAMIKELLAIQKRHTQALVQELDEFIRKKGSSLQWRRTREEKESYLRALEKITGREGVKW